MRLKLFDGGWGVWGSIAGFPTTGTVKRNGGQSELRYGADMEVPLRVRECIELQVKRARRPRPIRHHRRLWNFVRRV